MEDDGTKKYEEEKQEEEEEVTQYPTQILIWGKKLQLVSLKIQEM